MNKISKVEKPNEQQSCDLIWSIQEMDKREIFFRNTCEKSCMVIWRSMNISGVWSATNYDRIPPQSELSRPISVHNVNFEVDYYFQ